MLFISSHLKLTHTRAPHITYIVAFCALNNNNNNNNNIYSCIGTTFSFSLSFRFVRLPSGEKKERETQHVSNRSNSKKAVLRGVITPALKKCGVGLLNGVFSRFGGSKVPERKSFNRCSNCFLFQIIGKNEVLSQTIFPNTLSVKHNKKEKEDDE